MRMALKTIAALAMASISAPSWSTSAAPKVRDALFPQLAFEQNVGQGSREAEYVVRGAGHAIELSPEFARIHLKRGAGKGPTAHLTTELIGANPSASGEATGLFTSYSNYLPSADPSTWRTHVPHYERVTFDEVYPGIDVAYYGRDRELEYDFIVEPGARPDQIKLQIRGAQSATLDAAGNLVLAVSGGTVVQKAPIAYQGQGAARRAVSATFALNAATQEVSFELGAYDRSKTLVIDPVLSYSTYFGGPGTEETNDIAIDSSGGQVIVGYTTGDIQTTGDSVQPSRGDDPELGGSDVFITKFNASGASLAWSTYLGGTGLDEGRAVALDASNNVIVAGTTDGGFPTVFPAQGTLGGSTDAFVAKLSANGASLIWSTYLGGVGTEQVAGVMVDTTGAVIVAGNVDEGFPTKSGYLMQAPGGGDGFIAKIPSGGGSVTWATYLGGPNYDYIEGISQGGSNAIVIAGLTDGGFPVQSALQATYGGGVSDAFLTKLAASGTSLNFSTYIGGSKRDEASDVTTDKDGNFVVVGYTAGSFPLTNAVQTTYGGGNSDMFVQRISNDGQTRQFSSYLGGLLVDEANAVATDASGNILVAGFSAGGFPLKSPVQGTFGGGGSDGAITKIAVTGGFTKEWATYLGGTGNDYFNAVGTFSPTSKGYIYLTGSSNGGFPTSMSFQSNNAGDYDAILVRLEEDLLQPTIDLSITPATINAGASASVTWTANNATSCTASGAWTGSKSVSGSETLFPETEGTYTYTLTCSNGNGSVSNSATLTVRPPPQPPTLDISTSPSTVNVNTNSTLSWSSSNTTSCTASGSWSGAQALSGATTIKQTNEGTYTYTLSCTGDGGSISKSATLTVQRIVPKVTISANPASLTTGQSSNLSWTSTDATSCSASGSWTGTKGTSGTQSVTPATTGTFTYTLTCTGPGGTGSGSASITVTTPAPTLTLSASPTTVTLGTATTLSWATTNVTSCTASGAWSGTKAINGNQSVTPVATGQISYTMSCTGSGGTVNRSVTVNVVQPTPTVTIAVSPTSIKQGASATITWSSSNATSCTASGSWTGAKATSGSTSVTPTAVGTYTYTLSCTNTQGTGTGNATLTVTQADPVPTVSISVSPTSITRGTSANLTWASTNTTNCTASGAWSGAKALSGTSAVSPTTAGTYTYTLSCTGTGGDVSASATLQVVTPPPTLTLAAAPGTIIVGQSSTLTWSTTDATSCTASNAWTGSKGTNGSQSVTPAATGNFTYTLSCTGDGGSVSRSVTVTVRFPPPTLTFSGAPTTLTQGGSSNLTWSSTDTNDCTATGAWTGTKAVGGSEAVTPANTGSVTYILTCAGKDGSTVSKSVVLTVNPPDPKPTLTVSVSPSSVVKGTPATLNWTSTDATECTATNAWSGARGVSGSESTVQQTAGVYTYTLTCSGTGGSTSASASLTVTEPAAPIVTLSASPTAIPLGSSSALTWTSTNSTSCSASGAWSGAKNLNGTEAVTPASSGTWVYTISCQGAGGTSSATATVLVNPPPTLTIAINPAQIFVGNSATLNWSTTDATNCTASNAWGGGKATAGTETVTPAATGNYIYTLACTGPGGTVSRDVTLRVVFPAPSAGITATPSTINQGQSSTLSWTSSDTASCSAAGAWSGAVATSGSQVVSPASTGTYTYTLNCVGNNGSTVTASTTVTVTTPPPAPTVNLSVSPTSVGRNALANLTWSSTNATSCTASGAWTGAKATSGSQSTSQATNGTYTYTLSCTGTGGTTSASAVLTVTDPAPTLTLSASPTSMLLGNASTLSWSSTNATSCTASGAWTGSRAVSGSQSVTPTAAGSYTYTLACTGTGGTVTRSATVTVTTPPAPTLSFTANPTSVILGSSSTLSWSATNATSCSASNAWSGAKGVSGSEAITPTVKGSYTYVLTCTGAGGTVNGTVVVNAIAPPTMTLSASQTTVTVNTPLTLTWTSAETTGCTASGGWSGAKSVSGGETVTPTAVGTVTYTLGCTGPGGNVSRSVTVTVNPLPTLTFNANPTSYILGGSSTLTWSTTNMTSCAASGEWTGAKGTSGSETATATSTGSKVYTLTCTGPFGSLTASATVNVTPKLPTLTIGVSPSPIYPNGSATVTWVSTETTACTASGAWTGAKGLSSSQAVAPGVVGTYTYTLTCTGAGGSITRSATLNVIPHPLPTLTFTASPTSINTLQQSVMTWSTTNATACTATGAWTGAKATSGTQNVANNLLQPNRTYTLTCTGLGGSVTQSVTINSRLL